MAPFPHPGSNRPKQIDLDMDMDSRIMNSFLYFLAFYSSLILSKDFIKNEIYYKNPKFNLKNTNVTFGITRLVYSENINNETVDSITETLTAICQVELINKKKAQVSIDGIINLAFQDYYDPRSSGQQAILNLLSSNLYFTENGKKVNQFYDLNLTGLFAFSTFGTSKINSLSSNYYGIPFITSGDYARPNPDNQFSGSFPAENATFAQVSNALEFNSFDAVLQVLNHFNWTLVGNLFQSNTYGYNRQESVLDYNAQNYEPIFTCNFVYGTADLYQKNENFDIDSFCRCVQSKASINVIILWMSNLAAFSAIEYLNLKCSASKKWTFIISDDFQSPVKFTPNENLFQNSLLLRNTGPWDFEGFINECKEYASPETKKKILSLLDIIYYTSFKCKFNVEDSDIPLCPDSIQARKGECACTNKENISDSYTSNLFYIADGLRVYAEAISLLQNNCTLLNENIENIKFNDNLPADFCSITEFTPIQLSYAMRFVNFTGYTGPISFPNNILIRKAISYYLYSVYNNSFDATLVGYINETGTTIYDNLVSFINNEVPVSEIVPQNPDLSYAVVSVFFGIGIAELVICIGLLIFLIYYRNNRVIRQCTPLVTMTMLIGVIGLSLAQIFSSFARTDAWCGIILYLFRISLNLILMALLVKNYRIYKIFANKKATAIIITESRLLFYIAITTLFYIIFLTVFVAVFGYKAIIRQSTSNQFYQFVKCLIPNKTWNKIFQIFLEIIVIIQLIASLILAWLTRKVHADYRESRRLAAFATILFASVIIFVPLNLTLDDSTNSQIFRNVIVSEFLTITILSAVALLFMPIVFSVYAKKKEENSNRYAPVLSNIE